MRSYIRHPYDMPIELHLEGAGGSGPTRLRDVGFGGLAFVSAEALPVGAEVTVRIPCGCPPFEVAARTPRTSREPEARARPLLLRVPHPF